ncbi:23 kDa integral membrane protein-like [Cimex lectularius]|uniref:Tetraspanin n=1 Tax=Cimex lectularius TaxID=79782 RepID=A0A8I6RA02_CIMLE|nr:23 kDa integral membrane protein-like [Cimex lectularius]
MSVFKRVFLLISTGVCGVIGITMITLGAKEIMDGTFLDGFAKEHRYITAVFITLGVVIFLLSAIGFLGVILQNNTLLRMYAYLMLTLIVIQVLTGFLILLFIDDIRNSMFNKLNEKFKNYEKNKNEIDQLQLILKCCGLAGARNWNVTLPASCCGLTTGNCTVSSAYPDSCTQRAENALVTTLYVLSISSLLIVLFEIKCIILACCLSNVESPTQTRRQLSPKFGKRKRSSDESSSSSSSSSSSNEEQKTNKKINEDQKKK